MAFKIKNKKVNRKFLYTCIKAQQLKINEMYAAMNAQNNTRAHLEKRVKELLIQNDALGPYPTKVENGLSHIGA